MSFTELCNPIFVQSIDDYHKTDNVDTLIRNPYPLKSIEYYLYLKNWIDAAPAPQKVSFHSRKYPILTTMCPEKGFIVVFHAVLAHVGRAPDF